MWVKGILKKICTEWWKNERLLNQMWDRRGKRGKKGTGSTLQPIAPYFFGFLDRLLARWRGSCPGSGCAAIHSWGRIWRRQGRGGPHPSQYFDRGILTGEHHPITHYRRINKESVIALMKKYGMKLEDQIELQGNSDSLDKTSTSGQGAKNDTKKHSPHCGWWIRGSGIFSEGNMSQGDSAAKPPV